MAIKRNTQSTFNNERLADVYFLVGMDNHQQQRIPAHTLVLSVGSCVFEKIFFGALPTKSDEIQSPDIEPSAFLTFLKFIYSDVVDVDPKTVLSTLYTAKKYQVPALEWYCMDFLLSNVNIDNAFLMLTQGRFFDAPQLAAACFGMIDKNTPDAIKAESFTDIDLDTLVAVLVRGTLRIKELNLFEAILRWSEVECIRKGLNLTPENQRSVLGRIFALIRFPLMPIEEFAAGPVQSGLVTGHEVQQLMTYFTRYPKVSVGFSDEPQRCMVGKQQSAVRWNPAKRMYGIHCCRNDLLQFMVDRRIFVVGFVLYGSFVPVEYDVHFELIHSATSKSCGWNESTISSDGSKQKYQVMFKEPIQIIPNTKYTAYVSFEILGPLQIQVSELRHVLAN